MRATIAILVTFSLLLVMALSCGEDKKPSQPVDKFTIEDFQNAVGTSWLYGVRDTISNFYKEIGIYIFDTITLFDEESATIWLFYDSDFVSEIQHVSIVGDSVKYYCGRCSEPYRILQFPLEIGNAWYDDVADGVDIYSVTANENVSVPAGEYNTQKINIELTPMALDPMRNLTIWMAPDVGMVKMELAEGFRIIEKFEIWELIDYSPPD